MSLFDFSHGNPGLLQHWKFFGKQVRFPQSGVNESLYLLWRWIGYPLNFCAYVFKHFPGGQRQSAQFRCINLCVSIDDTEIAVYDGTVEKRG